jgi:hypothetical protein
MHKPKEVLVRILATMPSDDHRSVFSRFWGIDGGARFPIDAIAKEMGFKSHQHASDLLEQANRALFLERDACRAVVMCSGRLSDDYFDKLVRLAVNSVGYAGEVARQRQEFRVELIALAHGQAAPLNAVRPQPKAAPRWLKPE